MREASEKSESEKEIDLQKVRERERPEREAREKPESEKERTSEPESEKERASEASEATPEKKRHSPICPSSPSTQPFVCGEWPTSIKPERNAKGTARQKICCCAHGDATACVSHSVFLILCERSSKRTWTTVLFFNVLNP